jgi:hypothetical protein
MSSLPVVRNWFAAGQVVPEAEQEASMGWQYLGIFEKAPDIAHIGFLSGAADICEIVVIIDPREEASVEVAPVHLKEVSEKDHIFFPGSKTRFLSKLAKSGIE